MRSRFPLLCCLVVGCAANPEPQAPTARPVVPEDEASEMTMVEKPRAAAPEEKPLEAQEPLRSSKKHTPLVVTPLPKK